MGMRIAREGWSFILIPGFILGVSALFLHGRGWETLSFLLTALMLVNTGFMLYFFRDPERSVPVDPACIVAGADGTVRAVERLDEGSFLATETVRISTFLSPFNVHINRSPIGGIVKKLDYTPGKKLLTIQNAASEYNEHSSILIAGERTSCLVKQIVGPVVRRVIYWLDINQKLQSGERIGLMKFGSRLDVYVPASDVDILVKKGDRVRAGETVIAMMKKGRIYELATIDSNLFYVSRHAGRFFQSVDGGGGRLYVRG